MSPGRTSRPGSAARSRAGRRRSRRRRRRCARRAARRPRGSGRPSSSTTMASTSRNAPSRTYPRMQMARPRESPSVTPPPRTIRTPPAPRVHSRAEQRVPQVDGETPASHDRRRRRAAAADPAAASRSSAPRAAGRGDHQVHLPRREVGVGAAAAEQKPPRRPCASQAARGAVNP